MDQNLHLIDKYFQGKLDQEELQLFNQKLQEDSDFEQEFRDMKLMRDAVKETSRIKALDVLMNAEANLTKQETTKINVSMKRLVSIAASLLIIATVSYFAFSDRTGALTGEEIVATYYEPYTNIVSGGVRGVDDNLRTLNARAYNAYDVGDYATSADLFEELLASEKTAANYLYSGIANLETGNLETAKNNLNTVMNNYAELKEQAQWYLAMTLFKEGLENEAIGNLAFLTTTNSSSSYALKAKRILKDMNLSLETVEEGGTVETTVTVPGDQQGDMPNGTSIRQYQYGTLISFSDRKRYDFVNDYPIDGLRKGDLVAYAVIKGGKKAFTILIDKIQ